MRQIITLFFVGISFGFFSQGNLVPAGDFELFDPNAYPFTQTPLSTLEHYIPCSGSGPVNWPSTDFTPIDVNANDPYYNPWDNFWDSGSGPDEPQFFSSHYLPGSQCFQDIYANPADMQLPGTYWGTINTIGGAGTNDGVLGIGRVSQQGPTINRHGLFVMLKQPLKVDHMYALEFDAGSFPVGIFDANPPEIVVALGTSGSYSDKVITKKIKIDNDLNSYGWKHYKWFFTLNSNDLNEDKWCSVRWLFIRSSFGNERAVIDNVKIDANCTDECSQTNGIPVIDCNNLHITNLPLTFSGLKTVSSFTLEIVPMTGQGLVAYIVKNHYCHDKFSWDGKNVNGAFVADAAYTYKLTYENDCAKCVKTGTFAKQEQYLVNQNNIPSYYTFGINVNQANNSTIEINNLDFVNKLNLYVYNSNNQLVRTMPVGNPASTIAFDSKDNNGSLLPAGNYKIGWVAENQCLEEELPLSNYINFSLNGGQPNSPFLNLPSVPKTYFLCDVNFQTQSADLGNRPCCPHQKTYQTQYPIITDDTPYYVEDDIIASNSRVLPGAQVLFHAGNSVVMEPGTFIADAGSQFVAEVGPCPFKLPQPQGSIFDSNDYLTQYNIPTEVVQGEDAGDGERRMNAEQIEAENALLVSIYPNPAQNVLYIDFRDFNLDELHGNIKVFDGMGHQVIEAGVSNSIEKLNVSSLADGIYYILISGTKLKYSNTFIVK